MKEECICGKHIFHFEFADADRLVTCPICEKEYYIVVEELDDGTIDSDLEELIA
jgi:hypothetical protein